MKTTTKVGKHKLSLRITRNAVKSRVKVLHISIKRVNEHALRSREQSPRHRNFQCNRIAWRSLMNHHHELHWCCAKHVAEFALRCWIAG